VLVVAAVAASHQLTPVLLVGAALVLWLVATRDVGALPVVCFVLFIAWFTWGASEFWLGHWNALAGDVGNVGGSVQQGVGDRAAGSDFYRSLVLAVRIGLSSLVWIVALLEVALSVKGRRPRWTLAAFVLLPFGAIFGQAYGGEMPLRIFFFGLPFAACLLAALAGRLSPSASRWRWRWPTVGRAVAGVGLVALVATFMVARYGNEKFEQIYPEDMAAVRELQRVAPRGAEVVMANYFAPANTVEIDQFDYHDEPALGRPDVVDPATVLSGKGYGPTYVLITRAQVAYAAIAAGSPAGWNDVLDRRLLASGRVVKLFDEGDARIYRVLPPNGER
jgi:hypothetical protein